MNFFCSLHFSLWLFFMFSFTPAIYNTTNLSLFSFLIFFRLNVFPSKWFRLVFYWPTHLILGRSREPYFMRFPQNCTKFWNSQNRIDTSKFFDHQLFSQLLFYALSKARMQLVCYRVACYIESISALTMVSKRSLEKFISVWRKKWWMFC